MKNARVIISLAILIAGADYSAARGAMAAPESAASPMFVPAAWGKKAKAPPLPACPAKFDDSLETNGIVPEGMVRGVSLPKPVRTPQAELSDLARKEVNRQGLRPFLSTSTIALVVDTDGNPRDLCVKQSAAFDLDGQAAKAVWQYRFEPAAKDGHPVAKRLAVDIRFAIR